MPTVAACKTHFMSQIDPSDGTNFLRILQDADTRLLESGRYRFCKTVDTLTETEGVVTLPSDYASILGIQLNGYPVDIHAQEFEFKPDGLGNIEVGKGGTMLIDQGLNSSDQREYKVTGFLDPTWTINALLLYAPKALTEDSDTTRCDSMAALKLACLAIVYEENSSIQSSQNFFQRAFDVLENQGQNQRGSARQTMSMSPLGRGVRAIRSIR